MTKYSGSDRPRHANMAAFLQSMQMSKENLFVFVEGDEIDPYFYGTLCSTVLSPGIFRTCNSKQIPDSSSGAGKNALIGLFRYLSETSSLLSDFKGKKTGFLFFLDKDIDDLLNTQIASEHVIYTYYYDVENHIVEHGDLKKGCAVAASMDPQEIDRSLGDPAIWLKDVAQKWKEWVIFCVFVQIYKLGKCPLNYSQQSQFNNPLTGPVDKVAYEQSLAALKAESGLSEPDFAVEFEQISTLVEDFYRKGEHGKVFKGKWYMYFLGEQTRQVAKTACGNVSGIEGQVFRHIASTLDFNAAWTYYFTKPLKAMVNKLVNA